MKATCIKCGQSADVKPTGRNSFSITHPPRFAFLCPILAEKLKERGRLDSSELDCPHLNNATAAVADQWRRRLGP
jgi:hypothetical protein